MAFVLVSPVLDLTDTAGIRAVLASTFRQLGRIDVLVSNAGYGLFGAAEEVTDAQIDHQISTNLIGSIQFIRAAIPHLRRRPHCSSFIRRRPDRVPGLQFVSRNQMEHRRLIESAAQEVASFGIDFIVVEPGPTATNFGAGLVHASPTDIYQGYARWCGAPVYC